MQYVASVNVEKTNNDAPVSCRDFQGSMGHNSFQQIPEYLRKDIHHPCRCSISPRSPFGLCVLSTSLHAQLWLLLPADDALLFINPQPSAVHLENWISKRQHVRRNCKLNSSIHQSVTKSMASQNQ